LTKVVVIGIDAASYDLIERWKEILPNLKRLMYNGTYGILQSTTPPNTCPAWPCFYTGKNPGKFGIYDFVVINDDGKIRVIDSTACDSLSLWEILSRSGKRVCVLNVPITYPPREVNGCMVSGFLSPFLREDYTFPLYLQKELKEIQAGFPNPIISFKRGGEEAYLDEISRVHQMQVKHAKYLLRKEKWDFFMVYFRALDLIQHHFWEYMDKKYQKNKHRKYANAIRDWYIRMDETIREMQHELPDDAFLMIMSDHGMQATRYVIYINEWLRQKGFLRFLPREVNADVPLRLRLRNFFLRHVSHRLIRGFLKIVPSRLLSGATQRDLIKSDADQIFSSIDWSGTRVYSLGGTNASLYVNLRGRTPQGIVDPEEYKQLRTCVMESFESFPRAEANKKIHVCMKKKEEAYWGKHIDMAPDLAIDFFVDDSKCIVSLKTGHGKIVDGRGLWVSGTHSKEGIWLMVGPGVRNNTCINAGIVDLAPTILYLLDVPIPEDMDGKVLRHGLSLTREPQYQKPMVTSARSRPTFSAEEREEMKRRLRALGYMD